MVLNYWTDLQAYRNDAFEGYELSPNVENGALLFGWTNISYFSITPVGAEGGGGGAAAGSTGLPGWVWIAIAGGIVLLVLIWVFAANLGWFPTSGRGGIQNIILPGIALGWFSVAAFMRLIRSSMLSVLDTEFVKLARVKGLPERKVIWKHALKNASIAPITFFGAVVVQLITGSVTIETVFAWPGVGLLALEAVNARDYQVVQAVAFLG